MTWFITKGCIVEEDKPIRLSYFVVSKQSEGPPTQVMCRIQVCSDPQNTGAPTYVSSEGVIMLVQVTADLSCIPEYQIPKCMGEDGHYYYKISFDVEVTYFSAYTKYELVYNGVNYGPVAAEYV